MKKYWALDLEFLKAKLKTTLRCRNSVLHSKYKYFSIYDLDRYIKSKVIGKSTRCDIYEEDEIPYEYLKLIKRFIIPSEIILTQEYFEYRTSNRGKLLERTKIKSVVKYIVDQKEPYLEPLEIIYYYHDLKRPYLNMFRNCFHGLDYRILLKYDKNADEYKYYTVNNYNQRENHDLQGEQAKNWIEYELFEYELGRIKVTPVENIESIFQTV